MLARRRDRRNSQHSSPLKPELGYIWESPGPSEPPEYEPLWEARELNPETAMARELVQTEWRVADLRHEIEKLGEVPKGRTRKDLAEQLAKLFLNEGRLAQAIANLSEEERRYYTNVLLHSVIRGYYLAPQMGNLWGEFSKPWTKLSEGIQKAGLGLQTGGAETLVPFGTRSRLPQLSLRFPTTTEPSQVVPAVDPRDVLAQIQQLLGLLQTERFGLRDTPRWKAPEYPYAESVVCWPPMPADAKRLYANADRERTIELWPLEPSLDADAIQATSSALGTSESWVEFLYHALRASGIVWAGSPVFVDEEAAQEWMALAPGEQLGALFRIYRSIAPWAAWWPYWRDGTIRMLRDYHGYWGLISVDESVYLSSINLRWALLEILAFLPERTWIAMKDILQMLEVFFPNPNTHRYLMGLRPQHRDEGWLGFLRLALEAILSGPLRAFGLVDLGPSLDDIQAIRLDGLQNLQWERTLEVPIEAGGQLKSEAVRFVPTSTTLEIKTPVPAGFMSFLLKWARPAGFSKNLVVYDLDVERLHRAFEQGYDPEGLAEAWTDSVGFSPLPEVVAWWQRWWNHYGQVRLYPAQALLQTRDAFTMQELQIALPNLQSSMVGMLTPKAALLDENEMDRILDDLVRQGYMPKELS
ncbi:MAG: hypothetical protein ACP5HS_01460 [Anaerolineae bacterium]